MEPELIVVKLGRAGYDRFVGCWLCRGDLAILVDAGTAHSAEGLVHALTERGVERLDLIFLTHIHIDHAGGLSHLLDRFPMARALCHDSGTRHLIDPARLWSGSRQVLGELADLYGPLRPVEEKRLISHNTADIKDLEIIETPGHAAHHLCFRFQGHLFSGEAAGNFFQVNGRAYLRPATPSRFFLKEFLESLDRLSALKDQPVFYAHLGRVESSRYWFGRFREQLLLWEKVIQKEMASGDDRLVQRCTEQLLEMDANLFAFEDMEPADREREKTLMTNSIRGYIEYLAH